MRWFGSIQEKLCRSSNYDPTNNNEHVICRSSQFERDLARSFERFSRAGSTPFVVANRARVAFRVQRIRVVAGAKEAPFRRARTSAAKTDEEHAGTARWLRIRVTGR